MRFRRAEGETFVRERSCPYGIPDKSLGGCCIRHLRLEKAGGCDRPGQPRPGCKLCTLDLERGSGLEASSSDALGWVEMSCLVEVLAPDLVFRAVRVDRLRSLCGSFDAVLVVTTELFEDALLVNHAQDEAKDEGADY